jgi:aminopeptidase N
MFQAAFAHEVAHQWFYGIVGNDQYRSPWLDESFASWSEGQMVPGYYRCDAANPLGRYRGWLGRGLGFWQRHPGSYVDVVYERGACALTALERMLGRERFLALIQTEVSRYRYGVIDPSGFDALLAAADPAVAARWKGLTGLP